MVYKRISPIKSLAPFIEGIWIQEDEMYNPSIRYSPTKILPTTTFDLAFTYGDLFFECENSKKNTLSDFHLVGQRTKPSLIGVSGKTGVILVKFYPWGVAPFLKVPLSELTNQVVDLEFLFEKHSVSIFRESLLDAKTPDISAKIIQRFLTELLIHDKIDPLIFQSIRIINEGFGKIKVSELAKILNVSRRHLSRKFMSAIGISPKKFSSIIRFQKALFLQTNGVLTTEVMHHCGYYDQAHMISEFKEFSNTTPKFITKSKGTELMNYFNTQYKLSHLYNTTYM
ncbi:MAG: helix-turn-helix transcriptional regulator [Balneola sp.]|nr:helix-turn-helix transcriptional regulator [Balneola sp.]MBO6651150.1 helix-turn-helix transcriptional regulator [Balneola sp.]MBO6710339.1 helix-turn-helix transcriptional regulator [Balneola sp.]MBO6799024.1 helix-turn-helix transcriptional regulator [Balneola sp.]MBO6870138.1 helix-turn-helix transcriptional regulator [Balneola sp.]